MLLVSEPPHSNIGTLNEKPLHAGLKQWYAEEGDRFEAHVDGFFIDIVRSDLLIEIQTRTFSAIKRKLLRLIDEHRIRLVYPIPAEAWIVRLSKDKKSILSRRKSPKRGCLLDVFGELVSLAQIFRNRKFSLEVLLIQEEEVRRYESGRAWRRKGWITEERRLIDVVGRHLLDTPEAVCGLIPSTLDEPFTTADLASTIDGSRVLAQQMAYCLREMGAISLVGKRGRSMLYVRNV